MTPRCPGQPGVCPPGSVACRLVRSPLLLLTARRAFPCPTLGVTPEINSVVRRSGTGPLMAAAAAWDGLAAELSSAFGYGAPISEPTNTGGGRGRH